MIDLRHPEWLPFPLIHFTPLHYSPVTATEREPIAAAINHWDDSGFISI